jgi:hypothetical protein
LRFSEGEVINNLEDVNFKIQHAVNCLKETKRESPPSILSEINRDRLSMRDAVNSKDLNNYIWRKNNFLND